MPVVELAIYSVLSNFLLSLTLLILPWASFRLYSPASHGSGGTSSFLPRPRPLMGRVDRPCPAKTCVSSCTILSASYTCSIGLEGESHALSKRMSAASMTSSDGYAPEPPASTSTQVYRERTGTPTFQQSRPSAIPRPSLQQSRPGEPAPSVQSRSSRSGSFQRSRTLSQPFPFDNVNPQTPPLTYPDATSRSNSPMVTTPRSTRIPVSRNRAGSASSHKQPTLNGVRVDSRNGSYKPNGGYYQSPAELAPDLWPVSEAQPSSVNSRSTMETVHSQVSKLVNEPPPFPNQSVSSRGGYDTPRMSTDSEERPFEHWYRGDVSRNGGVGELRVGRRQEMLEIANYGHTLRQASSRTAIGAPRSRSSSRGRDGQDHLYHRPRAGSVGARESLYIDDEQARKEALVMDERPLTDLDSDGEPYYNEGDTSYFDDYYTERPDDRTVSPPLSLERSDTPSTLVDASKSASFKSRLPTPTPRQISNPPRTETPTQRRSPSTAPSTPKISAPSHTPTAQRSPANGSTNANKRRAKSPAATGSVNAKRVRKKSPGPSKAVKAEDKRGSVAHYPDPGNEDLANAIPSWTQPVPASGNWDDVSCFRMRVQQAC